MIHTDYAGALRRTMRTVMGADACQSANVYSAPPGPFAEGDGTLKGALSGYRYIKRGSGAALALGLPGELADSFDTEWYMDLTPGLPVEVCAGDRLEFAGGDKRRVSAVRNAGGFSGRDIYRLYKLEMF